MLTTVFMTILRLSLIAGVITLAVLLLRICFKKAPRWIICAAWGLVALRLLIPFTPESPFSLLPDKELLSAEEVTLTLPAEPIPVEPASEGATDLTPIDPAEWERVVVYRAPVIHSGIPAFDEPVNDRLRERFAPEMPTEEEGTVAPESDPFDHWMKVLSAVWLVGAGVMLLYALGSDLLLRRRLRETTPYRGDKRIKEGSAAETPFILGVFRPVIYLPAGLDRETAEAVIAHEKCHLRRGDHLLKPFGFLLLGVYWFNPLLWVAYAIFCRDIEFACDEKVVKGYTLPERKRYASALLECGIGSQIRRRFVTACPLAFGEVSVKERVKKVLNYKKPAFWIILAAALALIVTGALLLTAPLRDKEPEPTEPTSETSSGETSTSESPEIAGYVFPDGKGNYVKITVPEGTEALAPHAFDGVTVKVLELPESITTIHSTSFETCTVTEKIVAGDKTYSAVEVNGKKSTNFAEYLAERPDVEMIFDPIPEGEEKKAAVQYGNVLPVEGYEFVCSDQRPEYCFAIYGCSVGWIMLNGRATEEPLIAQKLPSTAQVSDSWRFLCRWKHLADGVDYYEYPDGLAFYHLTKEYFGMPTQMDATVIVLPGTPLSEFEGALKAHLEQFHHDYFVPLSLRLHTAPVQKVEVYAGQALPLHYVPSAVEYNGYNMTFIGWKKAPDSNEVVYINELTWSRDAVDAAGSIDLWPAFAPDKIQVIFEGTGLAPQTLSYGESLAAWKLTSANPDMVFDGWSLQEGGETDYYANSPLNAKDAALEAIENGETLHLYPVFRPADPPQ